jgi:hypothetical protein
MLTFDHYPSRKERIAENPKFSKFEEIFSLFKSKLVEAFSPGQELCVDESLLGFRGRCPFRQYMPKKPSKYGMVYLIQIYLIDIIDCSVILININYLGIKLWNLVCNRSLIVCDLDIYLGKSAKDRTESGNVGKNVWIEYCFDGFDYNKSFID